MGCCGSKGESDKQSFQPHQRQSYNAGGGGGIGAQVFVSIAGLLNTAPLSRLSVVDIREAGIFAALFDVHRSKHAAEYSSARVIEVFRRKVEETSGDTGEALKRTFLQLDHDFLACKSYPDLVRATSGASGSLVYFDRVSQKAFLACSGGSNATLSELMHGLAAQVAEAQFLCPFTAPEEAVVCPIGTGRWKQKQLAGACNRGRRSTEEKVWDWQPKQAPVHIVVHQLMTIHENIILGSSGLWALASPDATALRSHFYLRATADTHTGCSFSEAAGSCGSAPNIADHLVLFADQQASERLPRLADADVVALVLTFKWPANSINQAYSGLRGATLLESLQAPPRQQGPSQRAQKHWRLIRTLCVEYVRAHRRMVWQKWQRTMRQALAQGFKLARRVEEELWKRDRMVVKVSPSLKVCNQKGQLMDISLGSLQLDMTAYA